MYTVQTVDDLVAILKQGNLQRIDPKLMASIRDLICTLTKNIPSVRHENEFFKAAVWESFDKRKRLRVHFWPAGRDVGKTSSVHGHGWAFKSLVLAGAIAHDIFALGDGERLYRYAYRASSQDELKYTGEGSVRLIDQTQYKTGEVYGLTPPTLHRVSSLSEVGSATLVLTEERDPTIVVDVYRGDKPMPARNPILDLHHSLLALFRTDRIGATP